MGTLTYQKIKEYLGFEQPLKGKRKPVKRHVKKDGKKDEDRKKLIIKIALIGGGLFGLVLIVGLIGFGIMVIAYSKQLPPPGKPFATQDIAQDTNIYDKNGVLLAALHGNVERNWAPLNTISKNMQVSMISAEDVNFYNEPGIDVLGIARAAIEDVLHRGQGLQGASTITQQLAKLTELSDERTIQRKVKELILTFEIEKQYSKDQILEAYLNQIPFGGDISGVRVASEKYFNIEPSQLDLAQSAFLAALPQAPSYYSPLYGTNPTLSDGNPAYVDRAYYVLDNMLKHSDITHVTKTQITAAKAEIKNFKFTQDTSQYKAYHFVGYVKNLLENMYGTQVSSAGYQVYTTLDYSMQQVAESEINREYNDLNNKYKFNGDDAAMVSIDPKSGEILAMVGSPKGGTTVNIVTSGMASQGGNGVQPGSSIKPMLYMSAFKNLGWAPSTFMPDVPISIPSYNGYTYPSPYSPTNFAGESEKISDLPIMNIDHALSYSLNIPAVEALYTLTPTKFINDLQSLGYSNISPSGHANDLSFAIGGENVSLLEHADAYGVFADEGTLYPPTAILKITDSKGKVLYQYDPTSVGKKVVDPAYPYMIDTMLQHYVYLLKVGNAYTPQLFKDYGTSLAGKTGTNNTVDANGNEGNASSLTFVGYTPDLVSEFWFGNQQYQGKPLTTYGGYIPEGEYLIPYWGDYMEKVLPKFPKDQFSRPADVVTTQICSDTGLLYQSGTTNCPVTQGVFEKDHLPPVDNAHVQVNVCPDNPNQLATPDMVTAGVAVAKTFVTYKTPDPFFQPMLDNFVTKNGGVNQVPTAYCTTSQGLIVSFTSPVSGATFAAGTQVSVNASIIAVNTQNTYSNADLYFNGDKVGSLSGSNGTYTSSFTIPATLGNGSYPLTIKAFDNTGAEKDATIQINVGIASPTPPPGQSGNITITSPYPGQHIIPSVPTPLKLTINGVDLSTVSSVYFDIYSNGTAINGSHINASRNGGGNEWNASYQFPPESGYTIYGTAVITGKGTISGSVSVSP